MDVCASCGQPPAIVCACSHVCLCLKCIESHNLDSPHKSHVMFPYVAEKSLKPNYRQIHKVLD